MEYTTIGASHRRSMIETRIRQNEEQHYQYWLNVKVASTWPDDTPDKASLINRDTEGMRLLELGLARLRAELAELPDVPAAELPDVPAATALS